MMQPVWFLGPTILMHHYGGHLLHFPTWHKWHSPTIEQFYIKGYGNPKHSFSRLWHLCGVFPISTWNLNITLTSVHLKHAHTLSQSIAQLWEYIQLWCCQPVMYSWYWCYSHKPLQPIAAEQEPSEMSTVKYFRWYRLWSFGFWTPHSVVADSNFLEEHASIFRCDMCKIKNWLGYLDHGRGWGSGSQARPVGMVVVLCQLVTSYTRTLWSVCLL
jgi:hypothetical protein